MIPADGTVLAWAIDIAFALLMAAMLVAFVRLARGPSLPDRVVALDLVTVLAVAFSALFAIVSDNPAFLDVAIALALVAFLATVAFARFAERRKLQRDETPDSVEDTR
ncbi:MAG: cation:proton antiporter [Alphaproteobacteria bacterium]|nr:cation:proton antiporter [Alphaproteobacteria bacterium]